MRTCPHCCTRKISRAFGILRSIVKVVYLVWAGHTLGAVISVAMVVVGFSRLSGDHGWRVSRQQPSDLADATHRAALEEIWQGADPA